MSFEVGEKFYTRGWDGSIHTYYIKEKTSTHYKYGFVCSPTNMMFNHVWTCRHDELDDVQNLYKTPEEVPPAVVLNAKPKKNYRCINEPA